MARKPADPPAIVNKKATFHYEIVDKIEAGIVLQGSEVKSLRAGRASLDEAYGFVREDELWLLQCNISPYENAGYAQHEPTRPRKLLVHKRELNKFFGKVTQKGLTLIPLKLYFNDRGIVKVLIALARGKDFADKRETIKARDAKRELDRANARGR
jgi:SsrA-binding protein